MSQIRPITVIPIEGTGRRRLCCCMIFRMYIPEIRKHDNLGRKLLIAAFCLLLSGCSHSKHEEEESQQSTAPKGPPPEVIVTYVTQRTVPIYSEFVGRTDATQTVEIRARVEGMLENCGFQGGDLVQKGQVLFTIDRQVFQASLEAAQAELSKAQAEALHAKQQVDLKQEQSELSRCESALVLARQDLERIKPLVSLGAVERRQLDVAIDNERRALGAVEAQKAKVSNTGLNQNVELKQALAHVSAAQAEVKKASLNLGYTTIRAPIRGIISQVKVHPGNLVGRGENTLLATISAVDPIKVNFSVSEATYLDVAKQHSTTSPGFQLMLADGAIHPYRGTFKLVDSAVNPNTGTINVQAQFPNPNGIVRPGQFARVRLVGEVRQNALLIPQRCVQEVQGVKSVLVVVGPDNKVAMRTVRLGPQYQNFFVVVDGLKAGETIILEGLQKARPGETVKISSRVS